MPVSSPSVSWTDIDGGTPKLPDAGPHSDKAVVKLSVKEAAETGDWDALEKVPQC